MVDYTCGNFPEYKVNDHVGHCYAICPYDTRCPDLRTRHMLGITPSGILPTRVTHIGTDGKDYFMKTTHSGDWGFECTFSGCVYKLDTGQSYFYR